MESVTENYADEMCERTETYLARVTDCADLLADAVAAYDDDPAAFRTAVERVSTGESECDAALRDLRSLVGESTPPNYTGIYLRVDDVARLYAAIDAVPNRIERFVRELDALGPALSQTVRAALREMAALTREAAAELAAVTTAYVERLAVGDDRSVRVTEPVERISALESECDGLKYDALAAAFDAAPTAEALVVRELVLTLDEAMDAIEDTGEQLLFLHSGDL